jgi:TRAP-type uncharacterized transport system fused permease subunit
VPAADWVLAVLGAFAGAYLFLFYRELATRPGTPTTLDLVTAGAGILLLLEATRRSLGLPMVIVAGAFIAYTFLGPYMPDVLQHKGASMAKFLQHQWITTRACSASRSASRRASSSSSSCSARSSTRRARATG